MRRNTSGMWRRIHSSLQAGRGGSHFRLPGAVKIHSTPNRPAISCASSLARLSSQTMARESGAPCASTGMKVSPWLEMHSVATPSCASHATLSQYATHSPYKRLPIDFRDRFNNIRRRGQSKVFLPIERQHMTLRVKQRPLSAQWSRRQWRGRQAWSRVLFTLTGVLSFTVRK